MPPKPKPKPKEGGGLAGIDRRKLVIGGAAVVAVVLFLIIRARGSSTGNVATVGGIDPNAIDPATGLSYAQEAAGITAPIPSGGGTDTSTADSTGALSALSSQIDNLSSYTASLGAQQFADEQQLAALTPAAAPASSTTPTPVPVSGNPAQAANTPRATAKPLTVPKTVSGSGKAPHALIALLHPTPKKPPTAKKPAAKPKPAPKRSKPKKPVSGYAAGGAIRT